MFNSTCLNRLTHKKARKQKLYRTMQRLDSKRLINSGGNSGRPPNNSGGRCSLKSPHPPSYLRNYKRYQNTLKNKFVYKRGFLGRLI